MTRKQRARLQRNRESQRLAFREHAALCREHGVKHVEQNPHVPPMASRRTTSTGGWKRQVKLPSRIHA